MLSKGVVCGVCKPIEDARFYLAIHYFTAYGLPIIRLQCCLLKLTWDVDGAGLGLVGLVDVCAVALAITVHSLTPKRCSSGQLYSEGARGTPSGTRRARDKLISVF